MPVADEVVAALAGTLASLVDAPALGGPDLASEERNGHAHRGEGMENVAAVDDSASHLLKHELKGQLFAATVP